MRLLAFLLISAIPLPAQQTPPLPETAEAIMARVAANHDQAELERTHFVYVQHTRITSRKGKSVMCEEITDSRITPSDSGSTQNLLKLDGKLLVKHHYLTYDRLSADEDRAETSVENGNQELRVAVEDGSMDRDIVENMRKNLVNRKSRDGISEKLFPLTTGVLLDYHFHLVGREQMNGRAVFHITFVPLAKDDFGWKGDAYIDAAAYEPVLIRTAMAKKVPLAIRTLLGTNVPGLGFTIIYAPEPSGQAPGTWFPVSFGTEFKLRVLFFLQRDITINAENRNFEKTHVTSTILPAHHQ